MNSQSLYDNIVTIIHNTGGIFWGETIRRNIKDGKFFLSTSNEVSYISRIQVSVIQVCTGLNKDEITSWLEGGFGLSIPYIKEYSNHILYSLGRINGVLYCIEDVDNMVTVLMQRKASINLLSYSPYENKYLSFTNLSSEQVIEQISNKEYSMHERLPDNFMNNVHFRVESLYLKMEGFKEVSYPKNISIPQDVLCKQCGRKVTSTDKECWWCCIKNPGCILGE